MSYLGELEAALTGPRRLKRDLLQEAADHLEDATEALIEAGHSPASARRRAEADFGPIAEVADAYAETLAVASSRRTAGLLLFVLSFQPFLWDSGVNLGRMFDKAVPDTWWYAMLDVGIEVGGGISLSGAALALVVTGVGSRWFPVGRREARLTALFTVLASLFVPLTAWSMMAGSHTPPVLWALSLVLMVLPLAAVAASALHTLAVAGTPAPASSPAS
ncbi:permease prefix domain 1-containing protein [Kineosporia sp. NBRC 101677]|uniref:permease prefix domain 1-containing protein n=1 Tax=Kineosporia sp. NBRC 101677 TaxID=3032197 RepID=UPI0025569AC9|nr:permease prefix domain 1-containing protein [Kineosporia sp. NBRC 101677]